MSNLPSRLFPCFVIALLAPVVSAAQGAAQHACAGVADANDRLACYDRAFPPVAGAGTSTVDLEAQRKQALTEFGFNKRQLLDRAPESLREMQPHRIEGVITTLDERDSGERLVTLDNGQAWLLTEVTSRGRLRTGDKVTVREAALGTYMLVTPGRVALRAKRLR